MPVYALLVTYNPDSEQLQQSINILKLEVDYILICNNSVFNLDITCENDNKCHVMNFGENLGIARAQSIGMDWCFSNGASFVLQMDQDSLLSVGTVKQLLERYRLLEINGYRVGMIGPTHYDRFDGKIDEKRIISGKNIRDFNVVEVHATLSSSCLISKDAYDLVGGMDDGLFIDYVDWEYSWRLKKHGYLTYRAEDILLAHRIGGGVKKIIGRFDVVVPSPIRHYYHTRNTIILLFRSYTPKEFCLSKQQRSL